MTTDNYDISIKYDDLVQIISQDKFKKYDKKELEKKIQQYWRALSELRRVRGTMEDVKSEFASYESAFQEVLGRHTQDRRLFLHNQINALRELRSALVPKITLKYNQLDEGFKIKLSEIEILPTFIKKPLTPDTPVLQIIKSLNIVTSMADAYLKKETRSSEDQSDKRERLRKESKS